LKILVVFYSSYGHIYKLAQAVCNGINEVKGANAVLKKAPETLSADILKKTGSFEFQQSIENIPDAEIADLEEADAIIFGTPTRFGNMCAQMKAFLDSTGELWGKQTLAGKVGSVFTSSATQHGGQESTILSFQIVLQHHGMVIAGLPYMFKGQSGVDKIRGGSPYGASTIAGGDGKRMPGKSELEGAKYQGKYVALLSGSLSKDRNKILKELNK